MFTDVLLYALWKLVASLSTYVQFTFLTASTKPSIDTTATAPPSCSITEKQEPSILHGPTILLPERRIYDYLDIHALANPTALAVQDIQGQQLTYAELRDSSKRLAQRLHALGVRRGDRVCLILERSIPHIVAIFSVLRVGAVYIPLDGALIPDASLADVITNAQPMLVLVSKAHSSRLEGRGDRWLCIEDLIQSSSTLLSASIEGARPRDPACIIYTSGTTGKPKGVITTHVKVANVVCQAPANLGVVPGRKVAQLLNVAFDMCAWEIFSCILNGGSLYLRGPRRADWIRVMKTVDVIVATPSILESHDPAEYPNVKVVVTGGEPCSRALADRWATVAQFYNCCGPTEVTILNTMHPHKLGTDLSIGKPTPNNAVYILDCDLRPVPRGDTGLMWAGGFGISLGYLNRPQLTAERFKPDPFGPEGAMMYNTGDLGRIRADGSLEHLGRIDDQVKVKGFRIELDGVSAAMRSCPGVVSACALLVDGELWGFYAPEDVPHMEVKAATALLQPPYAVPTAYVRLGSLPLTSNGKIDKRGLRVRAERAKVCSDPAASW